MPGSAERTRLRNALTLALLSVSLLRPAAGDEMNFTAEQLEFFETRIRPLLVERCHDCHSGDVQEAGLRLDSRQAMLAGGDSGPAIVVGAPDQSRLLSVVGYRSDVQMPPEGKLEDREIEALSQWVAQGAAWPAERDGPPPLESMEHDDDPYERARVTHWSFQPIARPDVPEVADAEWPRGAIDHFVLARLEAAGLNPAPPADRQTLLRRATFDLLGLPPTADEIEAFERDESPDAYERVIDRLLASPEYGQRWGRHWLDVARYADTKGYVFTADSRYPFAFTYRDYVIRAFNEDLPFDRFITEQVAADHLDLGEDKRALAALGFLTLGKRFDNNKHDIIDDRIDVVTRGFLGLTVSCARCHDHKYDPIPTADYYSLYGVFASSTEPNDLPLISMPEETEKYQAHQSELAAREGELNEFLTEHEARIADELRSNVGEYLVYVATRAPEPVSEEETFLSLNAGEVKPRIAEQWRARLQEPWDASHPVFGAWHAFASLEPDSFSHGAVEVVERMSRPDDALAASNPRVREAFAATPPASMTDVAQRYGELLVEAYRQWQALLANPPEPEVAEGEEAPPAEPPTALPDEADEQLRQVLFGEGSPAVIDRETLPRLLERSAWNQYSELLGQVETLRASTPPELPRAMALVDGSPHQAKIFLRGNPARQGDEVPRQFLRLLAGAQREPFEQGSGRLELARAITDLDNPLTARVIVNRVWLQHFGQGLVRTPDDFGFRSEPPTHPELLDYLAWHFRVDGWSIKSLHRQIMLSSTYRQASAHRDDGAERDPENRLLWKMNRRRLEWEPMRDAMLAVNERLDRSLEGRSVDLFAEPFTTRRSVYGFVDRQSVPGTLRVFDYPDTDATTAQRPFTTVPQQALFLMNSPFVIEQAAHLTALPAIAEAETPSERVERLYRQVLARQPSSDEVTLAVDFVASQRAAAGADAAEAETAAWQRLAQALLCTNEFVFVD